MARPKKEVVRFDGFTVYACPHCAEPVETENALLAHMRECLTCAVCEGEGAVRHSHICSQCKGVDGIEPETCPQCKGTGLVKEVSNYFDVSAKAVERLLKYPTYKGYKIAMARKRR